MGGPSIVVAPQPIVIGAPPIVVGAPPIVVGAPIYQQPVVVTTPVVGFGFGTFMLFCCLPCLLIILIIGFCCQNKD